MFVKWYIVETEPSPPVTRLQLHEAAAACDAGRQSAALHQTVAGIHQYPCILAPYKSSSTVEDVSRLCGHSPLWLCAHARRSIINGTTDALKKYLRTRGPAPACLADSDSAGQWQNDIANEL